MFQPAPSTTRDDKTFDVGSPLQGTRRRNGKRWLLVIGGLVLIFGTLAGIKVVQIMTMIKVGKTMLPPPESVASAKVQSVDWQPSRAGVGTLIAMRGVTLGAEVTGTVREIGFENGGLVKKGQLIVRLDTSAESAQLQSAQADAALAKQTLERAESLRKQEVNTQAELENAQAKDKQSRAAVVNLEAIINKKIIRAPFDGRAGIRQVELGQVVSSGTPIVTLQTVTPIYVEFQLPQQALAEVKLGQKVQVTTDVYPGATWEGRITTVNQEVDTSTRNVRMCGPPCRTPTGVWPPACSPASTLPPVSLASCWSSRPRRCCLLPTGTRSTSSRTRRARTARSTCSRSSGSSGPPSDAVTTWPSPRGSPRARPWPAAERSSCGPGCRW